MLKDPAYTFGVPASDWLIVKLYSAPTINQPYYFEPNSYVKAGTTTAAELIDSNVVSGAPDGFVLLTNKNVKNCVIYLADSNNNILIEQMPADLFNQANVLFGKKRRLDLQVDPEKSFIRFNDLDGLQTYPAIFALNIYLKK